jgi:threonine synthase
MIRAVYDKYGVMIDPHTADGVKVGLENPESGCPLICLETALPAKFPATLQEALGREPARPAGFEKLEDLPQRFTVMKPDAEAVKRYIEAHAA